MVGGRQKGAEVSGAAQSRTMGGTEERGVATIVAASEITGAFFPRTLGEALRLRAEHDVLPYAGGTDLMVKYRRSSGCLPGLDKTLLFLGLLRELRAIGPVTEAGSADESGAGSGLSVGACATLTDLLEHPAVPDLLKLAVADMAAPGIRNLATLGGNICNASPAGDALPPLYVLDAKVVLASIRGRRILSIEDFILGPGRTRLESDELLTEILLPAIPSGNRRVYRKVGTRKAQALSKVSLAAVFFPGEMRIALGAVAPTVFRSRDLETRLSTVLAETAAADFEGRKVREKALADIGAAYGAAVAPIGDQRSTAEYRRRTAGRLVVWAAGAGMT